MSGGTTAVSPGTTSPGWWTSNTPRRNEFLAVNQYTVEGDQSTRRPDIVLFVNGLPLGVLELKVPGEERATLRGGFDQLRTYAAEIPALLAYNAVCVISTGTQARMGPLSGQVRALRPLEDDRRQEAGCTWHS